MFKKIISVMKRMIYLRNSSSYVAFLRSRGVSIGRNCIFRDPKSSYIDIQRPELITIGNNVDMNRHFMIFTHDWSSMIFRSKFHDFLNSTGKVKIGNNVYFGTNVTILKNVSIGDNCIVGAGSIVTKNIPSNSVAVGNPCRVICSIKEYYEKRRTIALSEAVERVNCFIDRYGRDPAPRELREEFIYYVDKNNAAKYESKGVPIKSQLAQAYEDWLDTHKSPFSDYESFIGYCKRNKNL